MDFLIQTPINMKWKCWYITPLKYVSVFQFHWCLCLVLRTFRQQDWFFFSLLSQIFFLGIACCFRSVLLSISEWRFKGHHQLAALLLLHNSSVVQCQKIILPNFPTTGCIKKCKGKKANNARHTAHTVQNWYSHWNQSLFEIVSYIPLYLTNIVCSCKVHIFWEGHKGHS